MHASHRRMANSQDSPYFNGTYCNISIKDELEPLLLIFCSSGAACSFLCAFAIIVMIFCRLFTLLTHRLIIYMLSAIFSFSFVAAVQILNLWLGIWKGEHSTVCVIESYFMEYVSWVTLLSVLMVTLHLTLMVLFPSFYLSMGRLEPFYFLFPWLFPFLIAWIPFVYHNYGISGSWCWIRLYNNDCLPNMEGEIEMYAVWYGELFVGLILNNIALVIICITLCKRAYKNTTSLDYRKALKQTLPLMVYPITYQFFSWFAIANRLYQLVYRGEKINWLFYAHAVFGASGGFLAPIFTLLYLLSLRKIIKENIKKWCCFKFCFSSNIEHNNEEDPTVTDSLINHSDRFAQYGITVSSTDSSMPRESQVEKNYETQ